MPLAQNIGRRADFDIAWSYSFPLTDNTPEQRSFFSPENHSLNPPSHIFCSAHCFFHFKLGGSCLVWMFRNSKCLRFGWAEQTRLGEKTRSRTAGHQRTLVDHGRTNGRTNGRSFLLLDITHITTTVQHHRVMKIWIYTYRCVLEQHLLIF
ncbi:hypothetical protein BDP81DRAFT_79033 [Colletotrichum phormii]|uniref:Uncharacterized protein n=1 Tax=Colletotrichum phormii TaxID=359342 RepID=A0AAJ0A0J2_9PEZI|nr:uncharacterized protein BDP81DRAFT_79033 [Colletotrichum phormii]KAK1654171.1 hypothetical protein BDP81DRAFT_79033 [Colletotrichum phormii]